MSDNLTLSMDLFPDLIVSEILTRLPAKSVCRFKSVSKRWKSIICNHRFILSYISRASSSSWVILKRIPQLADESTQHATQLTLVEPPKVSTFSVNPSKLVADPVTDPTRVKYPNRIVQSSNGLFLLSIKIKRDPLKEHAKNPDQMAWLYEEPALFVGNPITREWAPLPKPRQLIYALNQVAFTTRVDPGSGLVDKFMAVEYQPIIGTEYASLLCFSSDTGKWVEISANYMLNMHYWRADGAFEFKGRFFWVDLSVGLITWDAVDNDYPFVDVESVSIKTRVCRFISLPEGRRKPFNTPELHNQRCISTGGGVIQFIEVFKEGEFVVKVWSLDLVSKKWSFKYKVSRDNIDKHFKAENGMPKPCFVHPFDADVAYLETDESIFSLNVKTQQVVGCGSVNGQEIVVPYVIPRWPTPLPPRLYADLAKEQGTEHFKRQEFAEAIKYYSKSIDLSPSAVAYANRAMAYLKVHNCCEAENDCSEALKLDDKYFKVYARRATARKELGNLEGSMHDVEFALKLEPGNREMTNLHVEVKTLLEKASVAESVDSHGGPAGDMHMEIGE